MDKDITAASDAADSKIAAVTADVAAKIIALTEDLQAAGKGIAAVDGKVDALTTRHDALLVDIAAIKVTADGAVCNTLLKCECGQPLLLECGGYAWRAARRG
jgi:hypothetical protein